MGNKCGCGGGTKATELILNIGDDTVGVTHDFQYHDNFMKSNGVRLDEFGKFYRESSCPMHLMDIKYFLSNLDGVRTDQLTGKVKCLLNYVPVKEFTTHFKEDPNWVVQVQKADSTFIKMLNFDGIFLKSHEQIEAELRSYNQDQQKIRRARGLFDHQNSCRSQEGNAESTEWSAIANLEVDIFALQIYGFVVCRGSVKEKAEALFDLITLGSKKKEPKMSWSHPKFLKAIKLIFTYSELLPKKFLHAKLNEGSVQIKDLSDKGNLKNGFEWDEAYLEYLDSHFSGIYDNIFEALVERIFKNNVNMVNRKEFVDAIDGTDVEKAAIYAQKLA